MKNILKFITLIITVTAFSCAVFFNDVLTKERISRYPDADAGAIHGAPPSVVFTTVVLGGFRGLLTDILWLRASYLQDEERFFELVQLSSWITRLAPDSAETWSYHSHNMAYNVSVIFHDREERWRWINNGISLLRDEGLVYNRTDSEIYHEIARLYLHKIAGNTDLSAPYYRKELALAMQPLVRNARADYEKILSNDAEVIELMTSMKLDSEHMKEVDERFGPLDWRSPVAHSIYWGSLGRKYTEEGSFEALQCDRVCYQAMTLYCFGGDVEFDEELKSFRTLPRLDLIPLTIGLIKKYIETYDDDNIRSAYRYFTQKAIRAYISYGNMDAAKALLDLLKMDNLAEDSVTVDQFLRSADPDNGGIQ